MSSGCNNLKCRCMPEFCFISFQRPLNVYIYSIFNCIGINQVFIKVQNVRRSPTTKYWKSNIKSNQTWSYINSYNTHTIINFFHKQHANYCIRFFFAVYLIPRFCKNFDFAVFNFAVQ